MASTSSVHVSKLSDRLARNLLSSVGTADDGKTVYESAARYVAGILATGGESASPASEGEVVEGMRRLLARKGRGRDALKLVDAHRRLSRKRADPAVELKERAALMLVLLRLAENKMAPDDDAALQAAAGGGVLLPLLREGELLTDNSANGTQNKLPRTMASRERLRKIQEARDDAVEESVLVRDVLKAFQGMPGVYTSRDRNGNLSLMESCSATPSIRVLVNHLCELGWLFSKVRDVCEMSPTTSYSDGLVAQSFASALRGELTEYYRLIAVLETAANNRLPLQGDENCAPYLTLRRLFVWTEEPLLRMRWMAVLIDVTSGQRGGQLVRTIQSYSHHGDPFVQQFIGSVMKVISSPLIEMITCWVEDGELRDPHSEFFVIEEPRCDVDDLWRSKYRLNTSMLPPFVDIDLAHRILRTGKTINFLRRCCASGGGGALVTVPSADALQPHYSADGQRSTTNPNTAVEFDVSDLTPKIDRAASRMNALLMQTLFDRYNFSSHCLAVKRYLLLGQGDFIQSLMDLVGPELSQSASKVSSLKLAGKLEAAIRSSNAQYEDPDVLHRLSIRMLPHTSGEMGWDAFSLEYAMTMPLSTIFTEAALKKYLKIFNFLWRLKRAEYALCAAFSSMKPNAAALRIDKEMSDEDRELQNEMKRCHALRRDMMHFVTNLQSYIMFEVVEVGWDALEKRVKGVKDLDGLIQAHDEHLEKMLQRSLLYEESTHVQLQLSRIFDVVMNFRGFADRLYEAACESATQRKLAVMKAEMRTAAGGWGSTMEDSSLLAFDMKFVRDNSAKLSEIRGKYNRLMKGLVARLKEEPGADVKFFLFRLHGFLHE